MVNGEWVSEICPLLHRIVAVQESFIAGTEANSSNEAWNINIIYS